MNFKTSITGKVTGGVVLVVLLGLVALPIAVILVTSFGSDTIGTFPPPHYSFHWYDQVFAAGSPWVGSFELSAAIAGMATVLSVLLGLGVARGLARRDVPLRSLAIALLVAPLIIPEIVIALGLFVIFEPLHLVGNPVAIAVGHTVVALPIAVLILVASLRSIDNRLEDAAASLGAGRLTILRQIVLPLAAPGVTAAAVFAFITSFDEFFISQFLSSPTTITLPVRLFNTLQYNISPTVTAVSALLVVVIVGALGVAVFVRWLFSGRRLAGAVLAMGEVSSLEVHRAAGV